MRKVCLISGCFILLSCATPNAAHSEAAITKETIVLGGSIESSSGFPWWLDVKYPTKMRVDRMEKGKISVSYVDAHGNVCDGMPAFFDEDVGGIVFRSCLPSKDPEACPLVFILYEEGPKLEVRTYKKLFVVK